MTEKVPSYWRKLGVFLRLEGSKCEECGRKCLPPRQICPKCGSEAMQPYKAPRVGELLSWSVVTDPPSKFAKYAPYILGLVELEDGNRVIAQLTDVKAEELKVGMPVKAVTRRLYEEGEEGLIYYGYKFIPKKFPRD